MSPCYNYRPFGLLYMMSPSGLLDLCFVLLCARLASSWSPSNGVAGPELLPRSLWAEEVSLSLFPSYYTSPDLTDEPDDCKTLLLEFANSSATLSGCLVRYARPVRICQQCYKDFGQLRAIMAQINLKKNDTDICAQRLLQSDRIHMLVVLNDFFEGTWDDCKCDKGCLQKNGTEIRNTTTQFMALYEELTKCFNQNMKEPPIQLPEGNYSKVCYNCNESYKSLNTLYSSLEHSHALCIDLEDAMNSTRILWSREFNCTVPCTDTVPVIAVSAFIIFLPVVFYLSSFLHSEQKKLKLVLPKRFASSTHIQDLSN
uniref:Osteopetrosis-associated transmembrane protein 1 n=1 Tax=Leptobrachium leishanense TaxID=445787 RepID=A0A8C5QNV5_9ANUR